MIKIQQGIFVNVAQRALETLARAGGALLLLLASALASAQTVTYFHNDPSGTPVLATDTAGNVVWKENYRPYGGRLNNPTAEANNKLGFAGKPYDPGTGLSYMGARYYDPMLGRFMGADPAAVAPENLNGINRYAYANNNPYRYVDPDGHSPVDVAFLVWDLGKLGVAIYNGAGVGEAAVDVALSAVGVISPVPLAGQAIKAARAAERVVEIGRAAEHGMGAAKGTLAANQAAGKAAEARAATDLVAEGNKILGSQVSVRTSEGRRVVDHLIQTPSGQIVACEVKCGSAVRNTSQLAKDGAMAAEGGVPVGKNAPAELRGQQIAIPTIERRY